MKKLLQLFLITTLFPICLLGQLFGQSNSLLYSYKIPIYSYHNLTLYGQDFLSYIKTNYLDAGSNDEHFRFKLGLDEGYVNQTPMRTRRAYGTLLLNYNSDKNENRFRTTTADTSWMRLLAFTDNSWYLFDDRGFSIYADPGLDYLYNFKDAISTQTIVLPFGVGYGRIIGVKNVVQANIISEEIGADLSDEDLLKLAEIIEKYDNGYYYAHYRDDEKIQFYKEIGAITNKPGESLKIEQIINSPLYKTTERFVGWQVKAGVNMAYLNVRAWEQYAAAYAIAVDFSASAEYALPVDFDKQFLASLTYSKNLNEEENRIPKLKLSALFSFDHNYNWSSTFGLIYSHAFPEDNEVLYPFRTEQPDNWANLILGVRSDLVVLNSFSLFASLDYMKQEFEEITLLRWSPLTRKVDKTETIEFHIGFNYYIL